MDNIKVTDYEAVLATITKYTDACKEGKSEIMKNTKRFTSIISSVSLCMPARKKWCGNTENRWNR